MLYFQQPMYTRKSSSTLMLRNLHSQRANELRMYGLRAGLAFWGIVGCLVLKCKLRGSMPNSVLE